MAGPKYDVEQKFLLSAISICVLLLLLGPAIAITFGLESWSYKVARITTYPRVVAVGFIGAVVCIAPLVAFLSSRPAMRLACLGGCMGSFASFGMAYMTRDMDIIGGTSILSYLNGFALYYIVTGFVSIVFALSIAVLLNSQMLHDIRQPSLPRDAMHPDSASGQ